MSRTRPVETRVVWYGVVRDEANVDVTIFRCRHHHRGVQAAGQCALQLWRHVSRGGKVSGLYADVERGRVRARRLSAPA